MDRLFNRCLVLALLASSLFPSAAAAIDRPTARTLTAVYYDGPEQLNYLGSRFDVWHVERTLGYAAISLRPEQAEQLARAGFRMAALPEELGLSAAKLDERYFYYDEFVTNGRSRYLADVLPQVAADYPQLTELFDLGDGWETANGGHPRDILAMRITNEDPAYGPIDEKPAFFLYANTHAREVATPELALRYIALLLKGFRGAGGYGIDADTSWLVDHHVAYVLVMHNPDGHAVNEENTSAGRRKNLNDTDGCGFQAFVGVDLNRNHSFLWGCCGGSSGDPCNDVYRGSGPASEPEVQAFQGFFASVMEDQNGPNGDNEIPPAAPNDTSGLFISLHSYSDLVLWPWQFYDFGPAPNAAALEAMGKKFAFFNGYDPIGDIGYEVDGATDDWVYGKFGIPGFTFEVGSAGFGGCSGFFPDYGCIDGSAGRSFWDENRPAFVYAHKIAGAPYTAVYGPDAAVPVVSGGGSELDLNATIADRRVNGEPEHQLIAAEYFVDQPGEPGSGQPMAPSDGAWDETQEEVEAILDTSGLEPGLHYVLVRGQTAPGAWGPLTAAWFEVE